MAPQCKVPPASSNYDAGMVRAPTSAANRPFKLTAKVTISAQNGVYSVHFKR